MGIVSRSQGGGGASAILFDSTLGADAASIDTGAGGIAQTATTLMIVLLVRNDDAAAISGMTVILNNDAGANYDSQRVEGSAAAATALFGAAAAAWTLRCHGAGGTANYAASCVLTIPHYTNATFAKGCVCQNGNADGTGGNNAADFLMLGYRGTAAISRAKVTVAGAGTVLRAGSRMTVLGL